jgi:formamidopyrimidine-DNA glycosylase
MEERQVDPCPRCGGELQPLRLFTRWGRQVSLFFCRDCQYTRHAVITGGAQQ